MKKRSSAAEGKANEESRGMKNYKKDTTNILINDWGLKVLDALLLYHNIYHAEE